MEERKDYEVCFSLRGIELKDILRQLEALGAEKDYIHIALIKGFHISNIGIYLSALAELDFLRMRTATRAYTTKETDYFWYMKWEGHVVSHVMFEPKWKEKVIEVGKVYRFCIRPSKRILVSFYRKLRELGAEEDYIPVKELPWHLSWSIIPIKYFLDNIVILVREPIRREKTYIEFPDKTRVAHIKLTADWKEKIEALGLITFF